MRIIRSVSEMQKISSVLKRQGKTIGFVPTMGALHQGHFSLIRQARKDNLVVVVSIFVNPIQFGPREDFQRYPRPIKQDILSCKKEKVDFVFSPEPHQMYPAGFKTMVEVSGLGDILCGAIRPGHFLGVTTVVAKLFNIILPDISYFGQKDAQQTVIIQRMVADLNLPLRIKVMPIVRENGGLALSSRNQYLSVREKTEALVLSSSLKLARDLIRKGQYDCQEIIRSMRSLIISQKRARIDYVAIVDLQELKPLDKIRGKGLVVLAVRFGRTRLLDNIIVKQGKKWDGKNKKGDRSIFYEKK